MPLAPLCVNHVGTTVPDIFAAIDWYSDVLGLTHLMGPRLVDSSGAAETSEVFGRSFRRALQAHLLSGNGVGFELFEPLEPKPDPPDKEIRYLRGGIWHIALMYPDVDVMVARIVAAGGLLHSPPQTFVPGKSWRLAYTRDPWWTTIEIVSHSYAEMFSNWPQPGAENHTAMVDRTSVSKYRLNS